MERNTGLINIKLENYLNSLKDKQQNHGRK